MSNEYNYFHLIKMKGKENCGRFLVPKLVVKIILFSYAYVYKINYGNTNI